MTPINNLQKMEIEIVQAPDGSSLSIDVVLLAALARATIGRLGTGQGYCDTEILDAATKETTCWNHQEFSSSTAFASELAAFFGKLRDLPTSAAALAFPFELPLAGKNISLDALLEPLLTVAAGR